MAPNYHRQIPKTVADASRSKMATVQFILNTAVCVFITSTLELQIEIPVCLLILGSTKKDKVISLIYCAEMRIHKNGGYFIFTLVYSGYRTFYGPTDLHLV